jgi:peptidyl-prolyl cis-trans isomerase C
MTHALEASARHILVNTQAQAQSLKDQIAAGEITFEKAAQTHSSCPSGSKGGALGSFRPGMMVPEFDKVVFSESVGEVHGPVETSFGFHLIEITYRGPVVEASAKHILVKTQEEAQALKTKIESGELDFDQAAKEQSSCPSSAQGGALGRFGKGQMVPEFEEVVFSAPVGEVQGPVKTDFGYHLILVTERTPAV